jgi:hypothetical protein
MFISYERALEQKAELVDALVAFSGESVPPQARLAAIDRAQPGSAAYIRETRARNVEGVIDRVDVEIAGWLRYPRQPSCLVAERSWDQVCWAIEAYAWRFDGCARPSQGRRR